MVIELKWQLRLGRKLAPAIFGALAVCGPAKSQDKSNIQKEKVLVLNAREESKSCLWPVTLGSYGLSMKPNKDSTCPYTEGDNRELFLRQGKRTELRVFNRKFLTDYSITIDAVTSIQSLPNIRNLNEAENLSLGSATLVAPPAAKGGAEGLTLRTTAQILYQLLDEGTSSKPKADLDAEKAVLDRERDRIHADLEAFKVSYHLLAGEPDEHNVLPSDCEGMTGAPDAKTLQACLRMELTKDSSAPDWENAPYRNETEFRRIVLRTQDLIGSVKTFNSELVKSDLGAKEQKIESEVAQYENDVVTFEANVQASKDAVRLARQLSKNKFRKALQREQLRSFLAQQLKTGQASSTPNSQDQADMNELLDLYEKSLSDKSLDILKERWEALLCSAGDLPSCGQNTLTIAFRAGVEDIRKKLGVELPGLVESVNKAQSKLLNRVNAIYDNSEVPDALVKNINISGHPGNLIVYYTIRRIETFTRFTVSGVPGLGATGQSGSLPGSAAPPLKGAAPADSTVPGAPGKDDKPDALSGIVVSKGSFEVHSFFRANVAAAFAVSTLKDQSIGQKPTPLGCTGTSTTPDTTCFTPILNGTSRQQQAILAVDYYLHERDTFPGGKYENSAGKQWPCAADFWQCAGPMGGISLNSANNYFLGVFFEPMLSVQISGGLNFGSESTLQKSFPFGTPADVTGNFPTYQKRATGAFLSVGLDLAIFRKIFGKVTGLGTSSTVSGTKDN